MDATTKRFKERIQRLIDFLADKVPDLDLDYIEGTFANAENYYEMLEAENMCLSSALLNKVQVPDHLLLAET
ncbi:MAG: hypothetical protein Q4C71_02605 [Microbacteriaceae bacterium]|nr:hypothetical protein [Microbacteriaceae bacterium]